MEYDTQNPGDVFKKCGSCGKELPATKQYFYPHQKCRGGISGTCKVCSNRKSKEAFERRKAREPERVAAQSRERSFRHYYKDIEKSREISRRSAAKASRDPEKRAKRQMRKRGGGAGLTIEQFEQVLNAQGGACAICETKEPGGLGWNVDHCHASRKVRFILCCHCNRGLGAFKDNPETMRKAAALLEDFYDSKPK